MKIISFILFQAEWFLCVLYGDSYGGQAALVLAFLQIFIFRYAFTKVIFVSVLTLLGILADMFLASINIFNFPEQHHLFFILPSWLIVLWFCYCLWFVNANYINKKYIAYTLLCLIGGPLSYFAGLKLGALDFGITPIYSLSIIGLSWGILGIVFIKLNHWYLHLIKV